MRSEDARDSFNMQYYWCNVLSRRERIDSPQKNNSELWSTFFKYCDLQSACQAWRLWQFLLLERLMSSSGLLRAVYDDDDDDDDDDDLK
ncbi:hypothetical protein EVAR_83940_1 [Eumeta japonica]|uniref:Uncharacterized protein n=1 Tax=Eumeta variegata TaxID=151549 RepID=A0A4C1XVA5_EUMVA|nr:hypothetical protein EVAR_83940_1 [Eumeta japonica]